MSLRRFDPLIGSMRKRMGALHDRRKGKNKKYTMEDIGLSAFSVFCAQCSSIQHKSGPITYYHSAITPVIVAPGQKHAIALRPEFIAPQDGHAKQDCEIVAAKREGWSTVPARDKMTK